MTRGDSYRRYEEVVESYWDDLDATNAERRYWDAEGKPDLRFDLLERLLSRSATDGDSARSGGLAKALDMWIAEELRGAGFDEEALWPRLHAPRVLDPLVLRFIGSLNASTAEACCDALPGFASSSANVLGAAYSKQVDVGLSSWMTGPEILISTKTMGSSFAKNLANRFEEAYGDAKNLKGRHPLATTGFFFLVDDAIACEPHAFRKAVAMMEKLQTERDVYDVAALLLVSRNESGSVAISPRNELVPDSLSAPRFFCGIVERTLLRAAPGSHELVREKLAAAGLSEPLFEKGVR